jgi:hypothetical protein
MSYVAKLNITVFFLIITKLFCCIGYIDDCVLLQSYTNSVQNCYTASHMKFNADETEVSLFEAQKLTMLLTVSKLWYSDIYFVNNHGHFR